MSATRRVSYITVDRDKYDEYKNKETLLDRRLRLHYELFYLGGVMPTSVHKSSIENLEDVEDDAGNIIEGEATKLYRDYGLAPHPILVSY